MAEHENVYGFDEHYCKVEVPTKLDHEQLQSKLNSYFFDGATLMYENASRLSVEVTMEKPIEQCLITPKEVAGSAYQQANRYVYETPVNGNNKKVKLIAEGNFVSGHVLRVSYLLKLGSSE